jgi:hypothetical protein
MTLYCQDCHGWNGAGAPAMNAIGRRLVGAMR